MLKNGGILEIEMLVFLFKGFLVIFCLFFCYFWGFCDFGMMYLVMMFLG